MLSVVAPQREDPCRQRREEYARPVVLPWPRTSSDNAMAMAMAGGAVEGEAGGGEMRKSSGARGGEADSTRALENETEE